MEGFLIFDYAPRFMEGAMQLIQWVGQGKIKHRTTVLEGLAQAPVALAKLFTGDHDGKLLIKLA